MIIDLVTRMRWLRLLGDIWAIVRHCRSRRPGPSDRRLAFQIGRLGRFRRSTSHKRDSVSQMRAVCHREEPWFSYVLVGSSTGGVGLDAAHPVTSMAATTMRAMERRVMSFMPKERMRHRRHALLRNERVSLDERRSRDTIHSKHARHFLVDVDREHVPNRWLHQESVWLRRSSRRSAMSVAIVERDRDPAPERLLDAPK